jgi:hypothetical protein
MPCAYIIYRDSENDNAISYFKEAYGVIRKAMFINGSTNLYITFLRESARDIYTPRYNIHFERKVNESNGYTLWHGHEEFGDSYDGPCTRQMSKKQEEYYH